MYRKDFVLIADLLYTSGMKLESIERVAIHFADNLEAIEPRFKRDKFIKHANTGRS